MLAGCIWSSAASFPLAPLRRLRACPGSSSSSGVPGERLFTSAQAGWLLTQRKVLTLMQVIQAERLQSSQMAAAWVRPTPSAPSVAAPSVSGAGAASAQAGSTLMVTPERGHSVSCGSSWCHVAALHALGHACTCCCSSARLCPQASGSAVSPELSCRAAW